MGTWKELKTLDDPGLQELVARLPGTIAWSHADSTVKKYLGAFRRRETWATKQGFEALPARDYQVALHLQHLEDTTKSKAEATDVLAWVHSTSGLPSPSACPFV